MARWRSRPSRLPDIVITATRGPELTERTGSAISVVPQARDRHVQSAQHRRRAARRAGPRRHRDRGPWRHDERTPARRQPRPDAGADRRRARQRSGGGERRLRFLHGADRRDRAHRGAARSAERALRLGRDRRRRQHHHQEGRRAGAVQPAHRGGQLRHVKQHRIAHRIERTVVLCVHRRRTAQRRLLALRLPHSVDRSAFPQPGARRFDRWAGSARVGYDAGQGVRFEAGALGTRTRLDYDQASGAFPDTPSKAVRRFEQAWGRAAIDTGALTTASMSSPTAPTVVQRRHLSHQHAAAEHDLDHHGLHRRPRRGRVPGQSADGRASDR